MDEVKYKIDVHFGRSECRAWLEAEMAADGSLRLVGMGSRTDYDQNGKLVAHEVSPTGAIAIWPKPEKTSFLARLFGA